MCILQIVEFGFGNEWTDFVSIIQALLSMHINNAKLYRISYPNCAAVKFLVLSTEASPTITGSTPVSSNKVEEIIPGINPQHFCPLFWNYASFYCSKWSNCSIQY